MAVLVVESQLRQLQSQRILWQPNNAPVVWRVHHSIRLDFFQRQKGSDHLLIDQLVNVSLESLAIKLVDYHVAEYLLLSQRFLYLLHYFSVGTEP